MPYQAPVEIITIVAVIILVVAYLGPRTIAACFKLSQALGRFVTAAIAFGLALAASWLGLGRMELGSVNDKTQTYTLLGVFLILWPVSYFILHRLSLGMSDKEVENEKRNQSEYSSLDKRINARQETCTSFEP